MDRFGHLNKQKFATHLLHMVRSENPHNHKNLGKCAHFVAEALRRSGVQLPDLSKVPDGHRHAYLYEKHLIDAGFQQVACDQQYQAQLGDIMIWHPIRVGQTKDHHSGIVHEHGHMQAFMGTHWVSDFRQETPNPWKDYSHARCFVYRQADAL
ncbi:MAG TPA: hypothetical protein VMU26_23015 [Candidatus Polarisedimenticolia bacterium]|nr:hypothetical protein [Candidatus Polarisedimenticolia bacterium]